MMKPLLRYQMHFLRFNFIFGIVAYVSVAFIFKEDLLNSPERLAIYGLILSFVCNFYSFLTTHEFRRMLFTLPISAKDMMKTVFVSSIVFVMFIFLVAAIVGFVTRQIYGGGVDVFFGIFIALPFTSVVMSVKHYALLRSDLEGSFGTEMLVYLGVGILFAVPAITLLFTLPDTYRGYYFAFLYVLCSAITYYMYKLCCRHADRIYNIVKYKGTEGVHESIHSK